MGIGINLRKNPPFEKVLLYKYVAQVLSAPRRLSQLKVLYMQESPKKLITLHEAISQNDPKTVELLLQNGANLNSPKDSKGETPLLLAKRLNNPAVLEHVNRYAKIPALHKAAASGNYEKLEALLNQGTDPLTKDSLGRTALQLVVQNNHIYCAQLLLHANKDLINIPDNSGFVPLDLVAYDDSIEMLRLLLSQKNVRVNRQHFETGYTALQYAAKQGQQKAIEILLQHGANPFLKDRSQTSAFDVQLKDLNGSSSSRDKIISVLKYQDFYDAIQKENINKIKDWIVFFGALRIYCGLPQFSTGFHLAVQKNKINALKALLEADKENFVNYPDKDGETPLMYAAKNKSIDALNCLLDAKDSKINLNHQNNLGETALHIAAGENKFKFMLALLEKKANINLQNKKGQTALHVAIENGWIV